jgi:hypothetical protein
MTLAVAETLVGAFCDAAGLYREKRRPPVDVDDLARRVGAVVERSDELAEDGRVEDSPWSTRILLRGGAPEDRTRFTLAHELGHLVLADPEVLRLVHVALDEESVDVERMCNAFAAELLMPRDWLSRRFAGRAERFDVVDEIMDGAGVSYAAAMTRLAIVLGWRSSLVYLQRRRGWAPIVIGGSRLHGLAVPEGTADALQRMTPDEVDTWHAIELVVPGRVVRLEGELRASEGGVLCLARLPRPRGQTDRHR